MTLNRSTMDHASLMAQSATTANGAIGPQHDDGQWGNRRRPRPRPHIGRCILVTVLSLLILAGLAVLVFWIVVRPSAIQYTIDNARVLGFNVTGVALNATFDLSVRSYNGNHRVAMYYDYVAVSVWYGDQMVAFEELAPFYQPRRNATVLEVRAVARGTPLMGSAEGRLRHDRRAGEVEVEVRVRARIRFKVGAAKTKHYTLKAYCSPVLLHFSSGKQFDRVCCDVDI